MHKMVYNIEPVYCRGESIGIAKVAGTKIDARHRIRKGEMTTESPHTRPAACEVPTQVCPDELPAAEDDIGEVAICHAIKRIGQRIRNLKSSSRASKAALFSHGITAHL